MFLSFTCMQITLGTTSLKSHMEGENMCSLKFKELGRLFMWNQKKGLLKRKGEDSRHTVYCPINCK